MEKCMMKTLLCHAHWRVFWMYFVFYMHSLFMSNKLKVGYVCFDPVICSVNVFLIAFWHLSAYQHSQRPVMQDWYQIDVSSGSYRIYIRKMTSFFEKKCFFMCIIWSLVHYPKQKMTFIFFCRKKLYKPINLMNFRVIKKYLIEK